MAKARADRSHILIICDTVAILEYGKALLEDKGLRVSTNGFSGELAAMLRRIEHDTPDAIILDFIVLDEQRGWQFLQALRMNRGTRDIPVIVCTAAAGLVQELLQHLNAMSVWILLKPFDLDHLLAAVQGALDADSPAPPV